MPNSSTNTDEAGRGGKSPQKGRENMETREQVVLTETQIKDIERQLTNAADLYYTTRNDTVKERNRGFCHGIAAVLDKIGYDIEWDDGKATLVKDA